MGKKQVLAGIDQDSGTLRGVRVAREAVSGKGGGVTYSLLSSEEVSGNLSDAAQLTSALKALKSKLGLSASDTVSTCLSGKQTYAAQLEVKRLPENEMPGMLKLELRKSMPFEASAATFDFQFLPAVDPNRPKDASVQVLVSAVSNAHLHKHLQAYERAGIKPDSVNVLPVSVANAFWASRPKSAASAANETHVLLHIGADTCTLVIDGSRGPFFTRSFSFSADEASDNKAESASQMSLQVNLLSSEITKSITYYKTIYAGMGAGDIPAITVLGSHAGAPVFETLGARTGYAIQVIQTARAVKSAKPVAAGKFDLAIALALQGGEA